MGVKKKGDFFSNKRSFKESFYPKFFIKKFLQWPLKKGGKTVPLKTLIKLNSELVYTPKSCRRLDLLFVIFIYTSLFKFRSTNLTFIQRRLKKSTKKKIYENVSYNQLEKNSIKLFSSIFHKEALKKGLTFFFLIQKYLKKKSIFNYRKKCYLSLMSVESLKKK
jgi:hypothetical protein